MSLTFFLPAANNLPALCRYNTFVGHVQVYAVRTILQNVDMTYMWGYSRVMYLNREKWVLLWAHFKRGVSKFSAFIWTWSSHRGETVNADCLCLYLGGVHRLMVRDLQITGKHKKKPKTLASPNCETNMKV